MFFIYWFLMCLVALARLVQFVLHHSRYYPEPDGWSIMASFGQIIITLAFFVINRVLQSYFCKNVTRWNKQKPTNNKAELKEHSTYFWWLLIDLKYIRQHQTKFYEFIKIIYLLNNHNVINPSRTKFQIKF